MVKDRFEKGDFVVWPPLSSSGASNRDGKSRGKDGREKKETPEGMIRSLQSIFCRGRYRSWMARIGSFNSPAYQRPGYYQFDHTEKISIFSTPSLHD
jgi:hypothetical protein